MLKALGVIAAVLAIAGCQSTRSPEQIAATYKPFTLPPAAIEAIKSGTAAALKDPESARFGEFRAVEDGAKGVVTVCGTVNAKNSFGGYTGMQPFIGALDFDEKGKPGKFLPASFGSDKIGVSVVTEMCAARGISLL